MLCVSGKWEAWGERDGQNGQLVEWSEHTHLLIKFILYGRNSQRPQNNDNSNIKDH